MKKTLALVLCSVMVLVFSTGCFGGADNQSNNQSSVKTTTTTRITTTTAKPEVWELRYYVDEFDQPTSKWYVANRNYFTGTFSNSATENSKLNVIILVDAEKVSFVLYEYGHNMVKNSYSKSNGYTIVMKDVSGTRHEMSGYIPSQGDRLILNDSYEKKVVNALKQSGEVIFYIYDSDRTVNEYLFTVETDNFKNLIK